MDINTNGIIAPGVSPYQARPHGEAVSAYNGEASDPQDTVKTSHHHNTRRKKHSHKPNSNEASQDQDTSQTSVAHQNQELPQVLDRLPEISPRGNKIVQVTIINTNDLHGYLPNLPKLAGIIDDLRKAHPDALVIDCGDVAYNPPVSDRHHFEPMPEIMNEIGYDITSLGNHEFQWGSPTLQKELTSKLSSDVLCSNALDKKTGEYLPGVKPYVIKEINGVKIGFIGLVTTKMATSAHPDVGKDVLKRNESETLKKLIPEVRAQGAELVVVMSHQGIDDDPDMARDVPGMDVIVAAHDHQLTQSPIVVPSYPGKTYIVEAGSHAKNVGETVLAIDEKTHELIAVSMRAIPTKTSTIASDEKVKKIIDDFMGTNRIMSIPEYSNEGILELYDYLIKENPEKTA